MQHHLLHNHHYQLRETMANTVCRHLLALLSLAILTWTVAHAKALQENEDDALTLEKRYQRKTEEAKEIVLVERDSEDQVSEEAEKRDETKVKDEEVQKRNPEKEEAQEETAVEEKREKAQESEDTEIEDFETRAIHARFTLVDYRGRRINGQREGLLLFNNGTVCDDGFSMNSAHAICRTMGYSAATRYRSGLIYGTFQSRKRILLDDVICTSDHWASCRSTPNHNCAHYEDILLTCQGTGFRLVNSTGNVVHGRTEGLLTYQRGTVCDDGFNMYSAHAICRVMGYASAVSWRNGFLYGDEQRFTPIIMDDVHCSAAFWNYCTHRQIGSHNCQHYEDVFLTCQPGTTHHPGFRLVDWHGNNAQRGCEGLLLYNGGTVCDDHFDTNAAHAICKVLGYRAAVSFRSGNAYVMQTSMSITMDDLTCSSTTWSSCNFSSIHDCYHGEDILLKCQA